MTVLLLLALLASLVFLGWTIYSLGHFQGEAKVWKLRDAEWDREHRIKR